MSTIRALIKQVAPEVGENWPWAKLELLVEQWLRFGRVMNLSGARDAAGLAVQIVESMQVVLLARQVGAMAGQRWVDVGSGAGFPGLVVAACLPMDVTLVEPRERRAGFLELMLAQVGKGRVVRGRLEKEGWTAAEMRGERFDWASARAVFAPVRWVEVARGVVVPGGIVVVHLHRGDAELGGEVVVGRVEGEKWSVRGYRCGGGE